MTKTYKIRVYECKYYDPRQVEPVNRYFTSQQLIRFAREAFNTSIKTVEEACHIINEHDGYVFKIILELTNEDFEDNVKPDGTIAGTLNLGHFKDQVPKSDYLIENFHKLLTEQQKVICIFLDKVEQLRNAIRNEFNDTDYKLIQLKAIGILKTFVHDRFKDFDRPDTDSQIMNMRKFNELDDETLLELLTDVVNEMNIFDLMSDESLVLSSYSDDFWHKLIVTKL